MFRTCNTLIFLLASSIAAVAEENNVLYLPPDALNVTVRNKAMPEELGNNRIAKILKRYYNEGLGGAENWKKIESLVLLGSLETKNDQLKLNAYQKKPNLIKLMLTQAQRQMLLVLVFLCICATELIIALMIVVAQITTYSFIRVGLDYA